MFEEKIFNSFCDEIYNSLPNYDLSNKLEILLEEDFVGKTLNINDKYVTGTLQFNEEITESVRILEELNN